MHPAQLPQGFDPSVADWVHRNVQPAGLATSTLAAQPWHYVPLEAPMRVRGVLAIRPAHPRWLLIPEQVQQLQTLARQIAIALERVHFVEVAQQAVVEIESERLRNGLARRHFARCAHTADGACTVSPIRFNGPRRAGRRRTPRGRSRSRPGSSIRSSATCWTWHACRAARCNCGCEWQSLEEVVGAAIRAAQHALGTHRVQTALPPDLPLVEFDAMLIERALVNLLENAAKYGEAPIVIEARTTDEAFEVAVRDHGPGLPLSVRGKEHLLFEKFRRGDAESSTTGVGLGLAICRAVVDAHGGRISAVDARGGGAQFTITLPRRPPPPEIAAEGS